MKIGRRSLLGGALGAGVLAATSASAQGWGDPPTPAASDPDAPLWPAKERIQLWPGRPPGAPSKPIAANNTMNGPKGGRELWLRGVATPEVHVFRPARPDGSALLSLPGGGYQFLSVQNEGLDVAQHFNAGGTTVFVLAYRLAGEGWAQRDLVALQDAQRAMRLIRANARELRIDPARLGIVGFSAGGHLAADLSVAHGDRIYEPVDAADRESARPAYAGLVYPVTSLRDRAPNSRSGEFLLGPAPSRQRVDARSPLLRVGKDTPPSFLVHASDDPVVPLENTLDWLAACRANGVKCDAHIFGEGGHGFGLHLPRDLPGSRWPELFGLWLRKHGG
ncbi:alpha/beta hydrolase [Sphingomonas parva]|uniref:Alpha/beta hydrolase n=1 Tax=Sphingomonas parva TaxID=2555898 RepID=A0A4Y8ZSK5_9SPHN|nr:alpha/beta hydrolase [Sphingomonas parva]TFI59000.1 alpha/beta hydrolase [Sphingomonas parva]